MTDAERFMTGDYATDAYPAAAPAERLALVDLLDRVLAGGVVITGEITLSVADVDLVVVSLRALLSSVSALAGKDASGDGVPGDALRGEAVRGHVVPGERNGEYE